MAAKRTTHRSSAGKKLYAVRDKEGKFEDIQTYKKAHGQDVKRKAKAERKPVNKIMEGLTAALVYAKIDALWRSTKKKRNEKVSQYDWGYRDGLMAARELFGTTYPK